jgi:membrane fusion protein
MRTGLFRAEALEANSDKLMGTVALYRPFSAWLLTAAALLVAVALAGFAASAEYTRKAHVRGYLVPDRGLIEVYAPEPGTVTEKHVREGQVVTQGDTLFVISSERGSREAPEAQAAAITKLQERRDSLVNEIDNLAATERIGQLDLGERIANAEVQARLFADEIDVRKRCVESAREILDRFQRLQATHSASDLQIQEKRQDLLDQEARLRELERHRSENKHELSRLRLKTASDELEAKGRRAATGRDIAAIEQQITEYQSRRSLVVAAPHDGVVTTILAERGQAAQTHRPLLSILPAGSMLEAQLMIPSRAIGFVMLGQTVGVRYHAFPYQQFGSYTGKVREITKTLIRPNEVDLPIALSEPVYRVSVCLDAQAVEAYGKKLPLQSGMSLDADVSLERRRLLAWLFEPLLGVARNM